MNKFIKVFCTIVLTFLLTIVINAPKVDAAISGDDVEELRGVWVSTVGNIDIVKQIGTSKKSIETYKDVLISILDRVEEYGLNAIFFQIRPSNDAFYQSKYNPWSEYFVGLGVNPGWDMLSWLIDEAHARGIQLHAWLNPYRVTGSTVINNGMTSEEIDEVKLNLRAKVLSVQPDIENPITIQDDEEFLSTVVAGKENKLILNPAKEATIKHIENTISEIIENYDVDGIHFDDYFYPSGGIETKYDQADYNEYLKNGGTLGIKDWRRSNVDKMVEAVHNLVEKHNIEDPKHTIAFGISPAAVWAPDASKCPDRGAPGGMNVICASYSSYTDLYADTKKWVEEEWLDYILPQVYYDYGDDYQEIVKWWANVVSKTNVKLYVGTAIYRVPEWQDGLAIQNQFDFCNSNGFLKHYVSGFVLFSYRNLVSSDSYLKIALNSLKTYCLRGALHPTYGYDNSNVTESIKYEVYRTTNNYSIQFDEIENANGYVVYGVPKNASEVDFTTAGIKQAYNQIDGQTTHNVMVTQNSVENFNYVIRIYDANNNAVGYEIIDFEKAVQNPGASITHNVDVERVYNIGEAIDVNIKIDSPANLPVETTLKISINGEPFKGNYKFTENEDGSFTYSYEPFMDGTIAFQITLDDSDVEKVYEIGPIQVGKGLTSDPSGDTTDPDKPASSCSFGAFMILPITALFTLIILRKREY